MVPALQALLGLLVVIALLVALAVRYWRGRDRFAFVWWWPARKARKADPLVPVDPVAMFAPGSRCAAGRPCTTTVARVAELELPTGRIIACDPLVYADGTPAFSRTVPPGRYPVDACVAQLEPGHVRVAAIRVVFQPGAPDRWSPAETEGPDGLVGHGYGVDAGLGCVMDARARDLLVAAQRAVGDARPHGNYYDDVLEAELGDREWVDHHPAPGRTENVVIVHSGWGDGVYGSTWGLDADGKPVWLVTDFRVLMAPGSG
jgi:hypothetical protein